MLAPTCACDHVNKRQKLLYSDNPSTAPQLSQPALLTVACTVYIFALDIFGCQARLTFPVDTDAIRGFRVHLSVLKVATRSTTYAASLGVAWLEWCTLAWLTGGRYCGLGAVTRLWE